MISGSADQATDAALHSTNKTLADMNKGMAAANEAKEAAVGQVYFLINGPEAS